MAAKRGQGKIVTKRITRGKRKGQTVRGYTGKNGKFTELKVKTRATAGGAATRQVGKMRVAKGGKFKGGKFASLRDSKGRNIHRHRDAKTGKVTDVVVKPKKDNKTSQLPKRTAPKSSGKSTVQRAGGSILGSKAGAPPNQTLKRTSASSSKKPPPAGKVEGLGLNRQKGNPRKGQISINTHDKMGRPVHIYPGAKGGPMAVTVKKKRTKKARSRG